MKVSKWNTVRCSFCVDVEMGSPCGRKHSLSFWLSDEQAPWGNTSTLSVQSRTAPGSATIYVPLHSDPHVAAEFRRFVGNKSATPADAQRIIGMIAADAAPRGELSEAQREAWDGFVEAVKYGYAVEIGGAA